MLCPVFILTYVMSPELKKANEKAISKVGEQSLIRFINNINDMMSFKPGIEYQFIENIVCQYFDVKIREMYNNNPNSNNTVNCRKMLSYMLLKHTDVKDSAICYLIKINSRTLRRYKKQMFDLIKLPISDTSLHKAYTHLNEIFLNLTK